MSLKELTHENHVKAEAHPFTKLLISGKITDNIYAAYLYNQLPAYHRLETLCEQRGLLQGLEAIKRAPSILQDFEELCVLDVHIFPSTVKYIQYLEFLTDDQLLAHLYVRHMGDMYGGQMIRKKVPGSGSMYGFEDRSNLVKLLRSKLVDSMSYEANICFDLILELFSELANEYNIQ